MRRTTLPRLVPAMLLTGTLACVIGGCASTQPAPTASMGVLAEPPAVLSLGAGDSLGRAVYVNDLILAAAALDKSTTFTNVDVGGTELLMDR